MLCSQSSRVVMERGGIWKPNVDVSPTCPRCGSSNTKFCYYNNYCLTQPRYFCKGCRRYWTKGGSLRNVPIGGGCRKSRRGRPPLRLSSSRDGGGAAMAAAEATSSTPGPDGPNIDLAVVYANFLNQKPPQPLPPPPPPPSFEFSSALYNMHVELGGGGHHHLGHEQSGFLECATVETDRLSSHTQLSDAGDASYPCGLQELAIHQNMHDQVTAAHPDQLTNINTRNHISTYALPPLPGEELLAIDQLMLHHHHQQQILHVSTDDLSSGLEPEALNIPNPLSSTGNESSLIDLPNFYFSGLGK